MESTVDRVRSHSPADGPDDKRHLRLAVDDGALHDGALPLDHLGLKRELELESAHEGEQQRFRPNRAASARFAWGLVLVEMLTRPRRNGILCTSAVRRGS